ncbi:MAG: lysine-sensitive aspartokinase 3 [Plesiomonas sp.]|uniref:lysine-sensitive aspartokinase 3 n=1 Tax=Plesiomonas sp. TaxID=2486279 RepID=UPI003F3FF50F
MSYLTVAKFGGTSVANHPAMCRCAEIVLDDQHTKVVVLSASAGVTNLLVALANGCDADQRVDYLNEVRQIQHAILRDLGNPPATVSAIQHMLENVSALAEAASLATSPALTDQLISHGELMSTLLFTELLTQRGIKAVWVDIRKVLRTDSHFGRATPNIAETARLSEQLIMPHLADSIIITQGFIGADEHNKTTTLGRGGSDYSAALLAEALRADSLIIWTDVDGIYTTDPRIVPQATRINEISFSEASEMATFGAKILHPATLLPAVRSDIPVFVGSSKSPKAGGTWVTRNAKQKPLFRALAVRRDQILLTLHSLSMLHAQGFLAEVFNILAQHKISVDLITTSEVSIALTLDKTGSASSGASLLTDSLLEALSQLCRVEVEHDLALVALIGNQMSQTAGAGKQIFDALSNVNIRMISYGASAHNLCLLTRGSDADRVVQILHQRLLEQ